MADKDISYQDKELRGKGGMRRARGGYFVNMGRRVGLLSLSLMLLAGLSFSLPMMAQEPQGPLALPPNLPPDRIPPYKPRSSPPAPAAKLPKPKEAVHVSYPLIHKPPSTPINQIIQGFARHEAEFKVARNDFTYMRTFVVQTINDEGQPDGEYTMTSDITYTPSGQRFVKITNAPVPTLTRVTLSEQDLNDLRNIQPFVLTTNELPAYNVTYVGEQRVDEIHTYVFDVAPKKIEKHHRYFQGRIWVDVHDLAIVKTDGKAVPNIVKRGYENLFPRFETYRKNIEKSYWFPVYTYADDILHFRSEDVHIRMVVRWYDYRRFRVSARIIPIHPKQPQH